MIIDYRVERWSENYPPNPAMLRLSLVREGYKVFQWADMPNTIYGSHKNDQAQSHWVVSGSLEIVVEYLGRFVLGPGDRDFLPANVYYTARVIGNEPVIYLVGERMPEPVKPKRGRKPKPVDPNAPPKKKRRTKAEKAAEDAQFESLKKMFGITGEQ